MSERDSTGCGCCDEDRRQALKLLGGAASLVVLGSTLGCQQEVEEEKPWVRVALDSLPEGERQRVLVAGDPVEVLRTGDAVRARSLVCSHLGCEVKWVEADQRYACPCHKGFYDADGRVVKGPPPKALKLLPVRVDGAEVVIGQEET